jgi:hypothetical protein
MLYAYGATIIEIVRRKEFCKPFFFCLLDSGGDVTMAFIEARFFYQRAQSILEVMAKASWVYVNLGFSRKQTNLNRIKGQREKTPSSLQRRSTWSTSFRNQRHG